MEILKLGRNSIKEIKLLKTAPKTRWPAKTLSRFAILYESKQDNPLSLGEAQGGEPQGEQRNIAQHEHAKAVVDVIVSHMDEAVHGP